MTVADLTAEREALDTLLHAMSRIPGAELVVAGGPPLADLRHDLGFRRLSKLADSLGVSGQVIKLCADSAIQIDVDDALRGHVFAVQDALFWVTFIVSITVAATLIPDDGHAPSFVVFGSVLYLIGLLGHATVGRRQPARQ